MTFFCSLFFGKQFHHLYYLLPYVRESVTKEVLYLDKEPTMLDEIKKKFPDINPIFISRENPKKVIEYLSKFSVFLISNNESYLIKGILPLLQHQYITAYVVHGTPQKFISEKSYMNSLWFFNDVTVFPGSKDIVQFKRLNGIEEKGSKELKINYEGKDALLLKSGNLRIKNYLSANNENVIEEIKSQIDLSKPTLLYTPTFENKLLSSYKEYSSIKFFIQLFNSLKTPSYFNWIIKVHPNVESNNPQLWGSLVSLKEEYCKKGVNIILEAYQEYLPFMEVADALISDRTTAAFDFLYFNKPIFFLDNTNECPLKIDFDKDIMNSFWLYQAGTVIRKKDLLNTDCILQSFTNEDSHKEIREKCKKFSFEDKRTALDIINKLSSYHSSKFSKSCQKLTVS
jgi:hypothetical protein